MDFKALELRYVRSSVQRLLVPVYLDAGAAGTSDTSTLNFNSGTQAGDRSYNVKVTQIPCGSENMWDTPHFVHEYSHFYSSSFHLDIRQSDRTNWLIISLSRPIYYHSAPDGCLQYFTGLSGTVQSFNYLGGNLIQNQAHSSCIRQCTGKNAANYQHEHTERNLSRSSEYRSWYAVVLMA